MDSESASRLTTAMKSLSFVAWDRFVGPFVYGWISRQDGRFDFIVIWDHYGSVAFVSSSHERHDDTLSALYGQDAQQEAARCQRCEDVFKDVPNVVRLTEVR